MYRRAEDATGRKDEWDQNSVIDLKPAPLSSKFDSLVAFYIPEGWQRVARGRGRNAAEHPGLVAFDRYPTPAGVAER